MLYYGTIQLNLKKLERLNLRSHFRNFFSLFVLRWCSDNKIAAHGTTKIILRSTNSADVFSHQKNRVFFQNATQEMNLLVKQRLETTTKEPAAIVFETGLWQPQRVYYQSNYRYLFDARDAMHTK